MRQPKMFFCLCLFSLLSVSVGAQTIKLGHLAPEGSPWDAALHRIAADWSRASGGRLRVKVFAGGIAGDEPSMIRKIRINQLQAAAVTGVGLGSIVEEFYAVQLPFLIRSSGEMEYVMAELRPALDPMFEEKGFTLIAWFLAGWAHLFSKTPVLTPRDAQQLRLQVDYSSPEIVQAWKKLGFKVVPVASTEVLTALQSDLVEAFLLTPLTAAALQWFGAAKNMMDMPIAPMLSGLVVSDRIWDGVPEQLKPELLAIVARHLQTLEEQSTALEQRAVELMLDNGLKIHSVPPQTAAQWESVMGEGMELITGPVVSADMVAEIRTLLAAYRQR